MTLPGMDSSNAFRRIDERIAKLDQMLREVASAVGTLSNATIYKGDLTVKGGGGVSLEDGGSLVVKDGGGVSLEDGSSLRVTDGGDIWLDPGSKFFATGDTTYVQITDDSFSIGTIDPVLGYTKPSMVLQPDGFLAAKSDTEYAVFRVDAATGDAVVTSSTGRVHLPYQNTGDSANTRILFDGTIQMVTSSLRYKQDPEDAVIDPAAVLQMRRRTWRQKSDVEADPNTTTRYVGFIAEELHDLGLHQFVEYDDEDRPNAIRYDRLTVALHALAEDQQSQIDALSARLDALETK